MDQAVRRGASLTQQLLSLRAPAALKPELRDINRVMSGFEPVLRRAGRSGIKFETFDAAQAARGAHRRRPVRDRRC